MHYRLRDLLVAVLVTGILTAIVVAIVVRQRIARNEAAAIQYLRTWQAAQEIYKAGDPNQATEQGLYADSEELLVRQGLIDRSIAGRDGGDSQAYIFSIDSPRNPEGWYGTAAPRSPLQGRCHFYVDETGVIRSNNGAPASKSSPPVQ